MNMTLSYIGCEVNITLNEDEIYITRVGESIIRYTVLVLCAQVLYNTKGLSVLVHSYTWHMCIHMHVHLCIHTHIVVT